MRILVYSPAYLPLVGGLELNTAGLASEMARAGHEVTVVTTTPAAASGDWESPVRVARRPGVAALLRWVRWSDVLLYQNVSLRGMWPLLLIRRPWVASHHSWYCRTDGNVAWADRLKRWLARRRGRSIAVSSAMAADLGGVPVVIPNAYRDDLFRRLAEVERSRPLLFVGRLVSDKGVDVLLEALAQLQRNGIALPLTVVGDGPERLALERQAAALALEVRFLGTVTGEPLVRVMNEHRILVVPSRYAEPFGIVALEGIACGCYVVGSERGGLADAIGPCGSTFRNGDGPSLIGALREALGAVERGRPRLDEAERHLGNHRLALVASRYLAVLEAAASSAVRQRAMGVAP